MLSLQEPGKLLFVRKKMQFQGELQCTEMTKVTASRIVGSRVLSTNGSFFLAFAFINVNYIILQLSHMRKDCASATAHSACTGHIHHAFLRMSKPGMAGCVDDSMSNYWISFEL